MQSLKKDFFWNTLGSLVSGFVVFILTVFITRFNGVDESGEFGFAFSVAATFSAIAYYGGRNYQVTDVSGEFKVGDYIKLRLVMSLIALFLTTLFVAVNNFDIKIVLLIAVLMGYRVLDAVSDVLYGVLQVNDRLFQAGKSNLTKSIVSIIGFIAVDYQTNNIVLASCVFIVVFIFGIVVFDLRNIHRVRSITRSALHDWNVWRMAAMLLPFALIMFLPTILNNISKYFIQLWHPEDQGYFNILILPLFFLTLVISFAISPFLTRLARTLKSGQVVSFKKTISRISVLTILTGILLLPVTYLFAAPALGFVFGVNFDQYNLQLAVIVASGILYTLATVYSSVLVILRKIKVQLVFLLVLLLVNITLSIFFINPLSIDGAIIVSLITNTIWLVVFWLIYNITINKVKEK